ncbi:MAG: aconitate hydratase [Candidatus Obscuribacter sp.]|nr:aconitate hydratase [Candidatus Obscuribacter sp.]MBL0187010.1 aconitate hydratase [Candidatus Obscuribacter sp.]MBP6349947.1 aconitate hydratase [Candidatus Obscuribacter sp.]MBP6594499.1 aconitate hydratase [Candidatus Obscuribacter sp.]MBP7576437.1 aconitate hydratase [Candidatus Obscuribacter sp.]
MMSQLTVNEIKKMYQSLAAKHEEARKKLGRPLTLTEKVLIAHLDQWPAEGLKRGETYALLRPDRVAMQDATAQMALLQFMQAQLKTVAVPSTVHCDHLIQARDGAQADMDRAIDENKEVYDFLASASKKHGIGFWEPGSGIIHQVVLENYAFPGGMMIGTDSHTPNAGGLGMIAIGVGGADAVDVMAGEAWGVRWPKLIGVHLKGKLNGWTSPKDVILKIAGMLTVAGGTGAIVEYFGPGTASISCTGKGTITNMGAELGATTSIFPYDERMGTYLRVTKRADIADAADAHRVDLKADPEVEKDPTKFFDKVIEIDLDTLEPYVVGPHTPDLARPISAFAAEIKEKGYPDKLSYALIGSCTNSSYEDMSRAANVAQQGVDAGIKSTCGFLVTPGSEQVYETIQRDGQMETLNAIGATVLANACGPCIGQWRRVDMQQGVPNSIITSFNRNFQKRNDGNSETLAFIGSPEIVTALALAGKLSFNPMTDTIATPSGGQVKLKEPVAKELPELGFICEKDGFVPPAEDGDKVQVIVKDDSERLQLLAPFAPWNGKDYNNLPILMKALGKCTTDHISAAGPWLKFRGHLDRISDNMFIGAINAFTKDVGIGLDVISGERASYPQVARHYKAEGLGWIAVGDNNYGEGSSREHAAMSPRFLGCKAVVVKSFARIHETNLKKQGILALTFANPEDYDKILETDRVSISGISQLAPGKNVEMTIDHANGKSEKVELKHTMTEEQIGWFKAGSALNLIREKQTAVAK